MDIREATPEDALDVRRLLDAAMLEPGDVEHHVDEGNVLVAGTQRRTTTGDVREVLLGTLVLTDGPGVGPEIESRVSHERDADTDTCGDDDEAATNRGSHIAALAVRRRHRDNGIGTALVERALERERHLSAAFDERVKPFYDALEFEIQPIDDRRYRGVRSLEKEPAGGDL